MATSGIGGVSSRQAQIDAANGIGTYDPFAHVQTPTADSPTSSGSSTMQPPMATQDMGGGAMAGLLGAGPAPTGAAPPQTGEPGTSVAGAPTPGNSNSNASIMFSGPSALRQGIGQRNPPNLMPALTGLRSIY